MVLSVRFLGYVARLAGARETTVEIDGRTTILDVLGMLAVRYGAGFASSVFLAPGEVHTHLRVFLGEREVGVDAPIEAVNGSPSELAVLVIPGFEGGSG